MDGFLSRYYKACDAGDKNKQLDLWLTLAVTTQVYLEKLYTLESGQHAFIKSNLEGCKVEIQEMAHGSETLALLEAAEKKSKHKP